MLYTIYKITNKINKKFYIGMHKTYNLDDGYMGSGKLIKRAIQKYGLENFTKEILFVFDNEDDMKNKEKELVVITEQSYNLCEGGKGGFGYINENFSGADKKINQARNIHNEKYKNDIEYRTKCIQSYKKRSSNEKFRKKLSDGLKEHYKNNEGHFKGKTHSLETIKKMQKSKNIGTQNSQYGTCWITNGTENKKIKKELLNIFIPLGYYKGRV